MQLCVGDTLIWVSGDVQSRYRISNIDGRLVKLLGEKGDYRQISLTDCHNMLTTGRVLLQRDSKLPTT